MPDRPSMPILETSVGLSSPESVPVQIEQKPEQGAEKPAQTATEISDEAPVTLPSPPISSASKTVVAPRDKVTVEIERILEEDLGELYASLPADAKSVFKKKGEEVAQEITAMVKGFKLEVARIVRLIRDWLMTIPKVNKFFMEQEAKIKTDDIIDYAEFRRRELDKTT